MQEDGVSIDRKKGLLEFRTLFPLVVRKIDTLPKECSANGLINYQNENLSIMRQFGIPKKLSVNR